MPGGYAPPTSGQQSYPSSGAPQQPVYPPTNAAPQGYGAPAPGYPTYPGAAPGYPPPPDGTMPPYTQAPYAYSQTPYASGPVRSLLIPSRLAIGGLAAVTIYGLLLQVSAYVLASSGPVDRLDVSLIGVAFIGYIAVFIYTIVTFMVWLHRASTNLWNTGHRMKWRPGWAIGAWFIPVANLIIPPFVIREVDRESRDHGSGLFALWAVAWTLDIVLERAARNSDLDTGLGLLSAVTLPVAAVAIILLIRRTTADQSRLTQTY